MQEKIKLLSTEQIEEIFERFKKINPKPESELVAPNPFCLLVSVVLSAQATDKSVNAATKRFMKLQTLQKKSSRLEKRD